MKRNTSQHEPKVRFQTSGVSAESSKQLSSQAFARAVAKDTRIISSHKVKKK
jgi:hypothetical protein